MQKHKSSKRWVGVGRRARVAILAALHDGPQTAAGVRKALSGAFTSSQIRMVMRAFGVPYVLVPRAGMGRGLVRAYYIPTCANYAEHAA